MKRIKFYVCPICKSIITSTDGAEMSCCGQKLAALVPKPCDEEHRLKVETVEDDYYITFDHEMTKQHYISFVACVSFDRMIMVRLYPEQGGEVRFPKLHGGRLYFGCNRDGLWVNADE